MKVESKRGRKTNAARGPGAAVAREDLASNYPALASAISLFTTKRLTTAEADDAIRLAIAEISETREDRSERTSNSASLPARQLEAADRLAALSAAQEGFTVLSGLVDAQVRQLNARVESARNELIALVLEREPVDKYMEELIAKFRSVGITAPQARGINREQIEELIRPRTPKAEEGRPRKRVTADDFGQSSGVWASILASTPDFDVRPMRFDVAGEDRTKFLECKLPPSAELPEYGFDGLYTRFDVARTPEAKAKLCWEICLSWLIDQRINRPDDPMRERAWTLLFGIRYNFAREIEELKQVKLPSPRSAREFLIVQRKW